MKHTPGPWMAKQSNGGGWWVSTHAWPDFSICHMVGQHEAEANAHLIAAAPLLFESLLSASRDLERLAPRLASETDEECLRVIIDQIDSSIAKAKGK